MQETINTRDPRAVGAEVQRAYLDMFPRGDAQYIPAIFDWAIEWFSGHYRDFQRIDAHYHDLEHTMQGVLCMARLLHHRHRHRLQPAIPQRYFELGMLAMLLHDSGYLKRSWDSQGTGAKYTFIHVDRSIEFAGELMVNKDFPVEEILSVQNMIRCTGVNVKLENIHFQDQEERITGYALGTADLLGQMAAEDYVEKIETLYAEFAEAAEFCKDERLKAGGFFSNADDMRQKTPLFWEKYVVNKINRDFLGLYRSLNEPYPDGPNPYIQRIEANIARLRRDLAAKH